MNIQAPNVLTVVSRGKLKKAEYRNPHIPAYDFVALPDYWQLPEAERPNTLQGIMEVVAKAHECIWEFKNYNKRTGRVNNRMLVKNIITDNGGISLLKNLWNSSGSAVSIMSHVVASPNGASTTLTAATGTSAITTLSVNALPAALSSGATLTLGYGGGTTQTVTLSSGASLGATSLTVTSFTPTINYPIGTAVVPIPSVTDNPSSVSGTVDSGALSSGAFTYTATSGTGNRTCQIIATLTGTTGNAGNYTEAYTSNAGTIASNSTASHVIFPAFVLNGTTNESVTLTEKA